MAQLTIIVPVYQVASFLPQCLDSILAQNFCDFTLLLMDDGSSDTSPAICDQYATKDPRVMVEHQQNMGVEQTILKAIGMVQTPYVGFVDGDDWLLPTMYQSMMDALHAHGADLVQCGALINGITRNPAFSSKAEHVIANAKETYYKPFFEKSANLTPLTNARWSKVYRTELLQTAIKTMPQGVTIGEDLLMNLAYLCHSQKAVVLAEHNDYCYRSNENSLTQKYSDKKQDSILRLYQLLAELATQEGYTTQGVVMEGKNAICSLMLDLLLSALPVSEKRKRLCMLMEKLSDRAHLLRYASERPLVGKVALWFVSVRLYWLISVLVTIARKVLPL